MHQRKQLFVDPKVQGALVLRAVRYWFLCLVTMSLALMLWRLITGPSRPFYNHLDDMWFWYGPAAIASLLILPPVVIDVVRLSNRFVGPLIRLRRDMRRLAAGEKVAPIHFRARDYWQDFAEEFNAVARRMEALTEQVNAANGSSKGNSCHRDDAVNSELEVCSN
jgi:methyl-accepting chemotaxis protein